MAKRGVKSVKGVLHKSSSRNHPARKVFFAGILVLIILAAAYVIFNKESGQKTVAGQAVAIAAQNGEENTVCSTSLNCKPELTCRQLTSRQTGEYYGDYKCKSRRAVGEKCKWDDHCESKSCNRKTGTCAEQQQQRVLSASEQQLPVGVSCISSQGDRLNHPYGKTILLFKRWDPTPVGNAPTPKGIIYFYQQNSLVPFAGATLSDRYGIPNMNGICEGGVNTRCWQFESEKVLYRIYSSQNPPAPLSDTLFSIHYSSINSFDNDEAKVFSLCQHCVNDPSSDKYCFKDGYLH
ncbi:MAG: hypothetical protein AABX37_01740 [Nanoarchaeota archaeon]